MKLYQENIIYASQIAVVKEERFPFSEFPLHYHKEYELILIIKGSGKKFIGDNISPFNSGDLSFLGPNLPHTYYNRHMSEDNSIHQIVIQFREDFLGMSFFERRPFLGIKTLFEKSVCGLSFHGSTMELVIERIKGLLILDETEVVIELLGILHFLSKSSEFKFISNHGFTNKVRPKETDRMSCIYDYMVKNFRDDISLHDAASVACLSTAAFCRYFKKYTRKTFFEFLAEMRIGYACKLLQENTLTVFQISLQSGFNNISYFNRKFKSITHKTPLEYQNAFVDKRAVIICPS